MSLSANLISRSPAFLSPLKDRELDLRGNKIAVIENLAATQDQFDSIDLSDNEIRKLECMAILKRLTQLLLNNNRITRISEGLGKALPKGSFLLVPFFCDIFVGEPITWNEDRTHFMTGLKERFNALSTEKTFASWE